MKKSTTDLLKLIEKTWDFKDYEVEAAEEFVQMSLHEYLEQLRVEKGMRLSDITRRSGLSRGYIHNIFSGAREPSRDKLLPVCLAMGLSVDETQKLLKATGYAPLYARIKRDSAILFGLARQMSVVDVDILLDELGEAVLNEIPR